MRIACWLPKAKDTHSEYLIPIAFPQQWLHACWLPKAKDAHSECLILIAFPQQWLHACWLPKVKDTHSEYLILIAFPQQWSHACWLPKAKDTHSEYLILFASQQQWLRNAPHCYFIRTLPVVIETDCICRAVRGASLSVIQVTFFHLNYQQLSTRRRHKL